MVGIPTFSEGIIILAEASPIVVPLLGLIRFRTLSLAQHAFIWGILSFVAVQLMSNLLAETYPGTNLLWLYHIYIFLESGTILAAFALSPNFRLGKKQLLLYAGLMVAGFLLHLTLDPGLQQSPFIIQGIEAGIVLLTVSQYFYRMFAEARIARPEQEFLFWLSLGSLVMLLCNLPSALSSSLLMANDDVYYEVWAMRDAYLILTYFIFSIAILCKDQAHPKS